jgi:4-coumarate--CoA ligase
LGRAYVVYKNGVSAAPLKFPFDVQKWVEGQVANHKFLRGGVVVVENIPKRYAFISALAELVGLRCF